MNDDTPARDSGATMVDPAEDDLFDEEWLSTERTRHRGRSALLALLAAAVVFLGGVLVQKHLGDSADAGGTGTPAAGGLPAMGTGGGGMPDFSGGMPGAGGAGGFTPPSSGAGQEEPTTTPAVIGTVRSVDGSTWVVEDLGGTAHQVRVTDSTELTVPMSDAGKAVAAGTDVTVEGEEQGNVIVATGVRIR